MMRASQPLLARGFVSRSFGELKRLSNIVLKLEAVKGATGPRPLYDFYEDNSVRDCIVMSDKLIGGSSESNLDFVSASSSSSSSSSSPTREPSSYARFHGSISTSLPDDRINIQRTGYAAFRTPDQLPTVFGRGMWDIDPYLYLAMRVKSDGRSYLINVQAETIEPSDLHQHRLFSQRPGQWETVLVKWNDFVRTNHGFVVEPQTELLRQKVKTVGIGLTDRVPGPFELCIERVWATNDPSEGDAVVEPAETGLKNRKGGNVQW
jgi:NADH dehydrogenase [ubiquinone] 1 alpha subcomplex assembly factor 1